MRGRRSTPAMLVAVAILVGLVLAAPVPGIASSPTYYLPAPAGTTLHVTDSNNTSGHTATYGSAYAWDFAVGHTEFDVTAARGGTVIGVRSDSQTQCWPDGGCWRDANFVLIDHGDGTSGLYMHLAFGSVLVSVGDLVATGQQVARADNTGFSSGEHLHFMVEATPTSQSGASWWWTKSVPVSFSDPGVLAKAGNGVPVTGGDYLSANEVALVNTTSPPTPTATPAPKPASTLTPTVAPSPTVTPKPTPKPVTGPPPKPINTSYALVSSTPTGYPGETDWVYRVRWYEPAGIASGYHIYTVSGCYGRVSGDPCVKVGMQIPPADLHLIGTVAGSAQSFLVRGTTGGVVNIEGVTKAVLVAAFNRFGESKAAIAFTLKCDAALCP